DVHNGVGLLARGGSERVDADRTPLELLDYRQHDPAIHLIESELVDLEQLECRVGDLVGDRRGTANLRDVTYPLEQPVGDAWGTPRSNRERAGSVVGEVDTEYSRRATDDLLHGGIVVVVEPQYRAEAVTQWS